MWQGQFEGWYFKQQCGNHTVAFIPARHREKNGNETASLQIIFDDQTWNLEIPPEQFSVQKKPFQVCAGSCIFRLDGCEIDCSNHDVSLRGKLKYSMHSMPKKDIMGPFRFVPAMQCRHSLLSLTHRVDGELNIGGEQIVFRNGKGYVEGDRGKSFPERYMWTQCSWEENCIMMSVADIPFLGGCFTGCISSVYVDGKERRFATYLGAKLDRINENEISIRQGSYRLSARLEEKNALPLRAPKQGGMVRTIRESLVCRAHYELKKDGAILLAVTNDRASFEAEWKK